MPNFLLSNEGIKKQTNKKCFNSFHFLSVSTFSSRNPWQAASATTASSQYSNFSRGTTLPPTRPYLGSNTTLDMNPYTTGYQPATGFHNDTSIKDQDSKLETSYSTQVSKKWWKHRH